MGRLGMMDAMMLLIRGELARRRACQAALVVSHVLQAGVHLDEPPDACRRQRAQLLLCMASFCIIQNVYDFVQCMIYKSVISMHGLQ